MVAAFSAALVLTIVVLTTFGMTEHGTDVALQVTARLSFLLFWLAYCGSAVACLAGPGWQSLKGHVRDFGLAFASAHVVHIGLVAWLCQIGAAPPFASFVFFGIAVLWTYALALLSIDRLHRFFGQKAWRLVSMIGLNYIAFAFAADFLRFPFRADAKYLLGYLPFIVLVIAAPVLRIAAFAQRVRVLGRHAPDPAR
jgi:hypothetical protein